MITPSIEPPWNCVFKTPTRFPYAGWANVYPNGIGFVWGIKSTCDKEAAEEPHPPIYRIRVIPKWQTAGGSHD